MSLNTPVNLIRRKRDGGTLSRDELQSLITGYVSGEVPDYQMSAFLMAVYFRGMTPEESAALTDIMLHSGQVIDLSSVPGLKVDKHSTGGVGDKVSLILAPMVAACGVPVPMISGRGLGHTGGTLDKLESIPGFRTQLSVDEYKRTIADVGVVLIGQSDEIAPADMKMYALRDVTGTIESIPLIGASIMSKKLAEGIDALVLDVKTGNGAFMKSLDQAVALAQTLVQIGERAGKSTVGFVTDMSQPLGYAVGNWLEVRESIECLRGKTIPDLMEVTYVLGGAMVFLGGRASSIEEGMKLCHAAIWSGRAYEKFLHVVTCQGGDVTFLRELHRYPQPRYSAVIQAGQDGIVSGFDTLKIGTVATLLGAGRTKVTDAVDPNAGIVLEKKIGASVSRGDTLATAHTDREGVLDVAVRELLSAIQIGQQKVVGGPVIHAYVDAQGAKDWSTPVVF